MYNILFANHKNKGALKSYNKHCNIEVSKIIFNQNYYSHCIDFLFSWKILRYPGLLWHI